MFWLIFDHYWGGIVKVGKNLLRIGLDFSGKDLVILAVATAMFVSNISLLFYFNSPENNFSWIFYFLRAIFMSSKNFFHVSPAKNINFLLSMALFTIIKSIWFKSPFKYTVLIFCLNIYSGLTGILYWLGCIEGKVIRVGSILSFYQSNFGRLDSFIEFLFKPLLDLIGI